MKQITFSLSVIFLVSFPILTSSSTAGPVATSRGGHPFRYINSVNRTGFLSLGLGFFGIFWIFLDFCFVCVFCQPASHPPKNKVEVRPLFSLFLFFYSKEASHDTHRLPKATISIDRRNVFFSLDAIFQSLMSDYLSTDPSVEQRSNRFWLLVQISV